MNAGPDDLLHLAVEGHGGRRRWGQISRFRAWLSITGTLRALGERPGPLGGVVMQGLTRDQRVTIAPFPGPGRFTVWQPDRQQVFGVDGLLLAERRDLAAEFVGAPHDGPWDDLRIGHLAAVASWNHFVAPFVFTRSDVATEESWPWREDAQIWRTLLVTYPATMVTHSRRQTCYFDDRGLLRRLDEDVDLLGALPAVQYQSRYREFDGIMVPTRRMVYHRNPDGSPDRSSICVDIHVGEVAFS